MAEAFVNVTEGSGKKLHAWDRVIGANTVLDEGVFPAEYPLATYTVQAQAVSGATAASHVIQLMAGASLNVRIRRIRVQLIASVSGIARFEVMRLTSAGTGGTAVTAQRMDNGDAAAGATAMTLPGVKGTESGTALWPLSVGNTGATPPSNDQRDEWWQTPNAKPIVIPAGTANGIALKTSGLAATTYDVVIEFVETSFL